MIDLHNAFVVCDSKSASVAKATGCFPAQQRISSGWIEAMCDVKMASKTSSNYQARRGWKSILSWQKLFYCWNNGRKAKKNRWRFMLMALGRADYESGEREYVRDTPFVRGPETSPRFSFGRFTPRDLKNKICAGSHGSSLHAYSNPSPLNEIHSINLIN